MGTMMYFCRNIKLFALLPLLLPPIPVNGASNPDTTKPSAPVNSYLRERLSVSHLDLHDFQNPDRSRCRGVRTLVDRQAGPWEVCSLSDKEVVWSERCLRRRPNDLRRAATHAADHWQQPLTDETILAAYVCCEERDPTDVWFTLYRSTLPKSLSLIIDNAEDMMSEGEEASSLFRNCLPQCHFHAIRSTMAYVKKQHDSCAKAFDAAGMPALAPSWGRFRHAFALVRSRSFALGANFFEEEDPSSRLVTQQSGGAPAGVNTRRVLLPLYDLLNHRTGAKARIETRRHPRTRVKSWHVISEAPRSPGDEIFNSYGDERGNFELLLQYGFCCPAHPTNSNNAAHRIAFDWKDVLKGLVAAQPSTFGDANVLSSLGSRLEKEERERRSQPLQNLALYSVNVANGEAIPSQRLKDTLETLTKIAATLGTNKGIEQNHTGDLAKGILDAMVHARVVELGACLQRLAGPVAGGGTASEDEETGHATWWREQLHTFLTAEREVLRSVVSS